VNRKATRLLLALVRAGAVVKQERAVDQPALRVRDLGLPLGHYAGALIHLRENGLADKEGDERSRHRQAHRWYATHRGVAAAVDLYLEAEEQRAAREGYCLRCQGYGALADEGFPDCPRCGGTGKLT
jgi:hypothetical protein